MDFQLFTYPCPYLGSGEQTPLPEPLPKEENRGRPTRGARFPLIATLLRRFFDFLPLIRLELQRGGGGILLKVGDRRRSRNRDDDR